MTEGMASAEFLKISSLQSTHLAHPPIHILSSKNLAGPELNQNLNLTARCLSHEPMYLSGPFSS